MGELERASVATSRSWRDANAPIDMATVAWVAALALTLAAVPLIALLAEPLGRLLVPHVDGGDLLPWALRYFRPEPREEGTYALALVVPALVCLVLPSVARVAATRARRGSAALALLAKLVACAVLAAALAGQHRLRYEWTQGPPNDFFTIATLVAAGLIAAAIAAATRSGGVRRRVAGALVDSGARRVGALLLVVVVTALWMLHAVQSDRSIAWAYGEVVAHLSYTSDETFALLNGLTPLVDTTPLYATLWPYVAAPVLLAFGKTLLVLTITTSIVTALALLAGYGVLRRATGSPLAALALYLPFLATSLFTLSGDSRDRLTAATSLADLPLRYAAPLVLAWLTARELDRAEPRRAWGLFAAAGLILLNNVGVGLPALVATLATVAATAPRRGRATLTLARDAAAGLLLAGATVALATLARSGSLPHFERLVEFSRLYQGGYGATPLHSLLGLHLAVYLTFAVAVVAAAVRLREQAPGRVLTGMLLWNGVFGLGALSYFVAESGLLWLLASFSTWALTVMLLTVLVVRRLAARNALWPDPADAAVLFGAGLMICSLAQFPAPWTQITRLTSAHRGERLVAAEAQPFVADPRARTFVASLADGHAFYVRQGAPVALLFENGHRVADAYGVVNVSPYANIYEMFARDSVRMVVGALRRAGGNTLVMPLEAEPAGDVSAQLVALGFGIVTRRGIETVDAAVVPERRRVRGQTLVKWVDLRNLHPRALRSEQGTRVALTPAG